MNKLLRRILMSIGVVLLGLLLLIAGVLLARDGIATSLIKKGVAKTGFGLELKQLHIALAPPGLEIESLKLTNPPDFPEAGALELRQVKVAYNRSASTKEETRLKEVTFNIPNLTIVRKADGEVNFQRFAKQSKQEKTAGGEQPAPQPAPDKKKVERKVRIDQLSFRIGTVLIRTYKTGQKDPSEQKFELNLDKKYTNVTNDDLKKIVSQLMLEIVFKAPPEQLVGDLISGKPGAGAKAKDAAKQFGNQLKDFFQSLKQQKPQ